MVWVCNTAQTQDRLWIVFKKVDSEVHEESHEHFMSPSFENLCDENFIFQQDSDSFRYSKYTSKLLQEEEINILY